MADEIEQKLASLYDDEQVWDAHDAADQDLRRARWVAILTGWVLNHDEMVSKLLDPMTLPELIDLDASITSLRYEVRRAVTKLDAPADKDPSDADPGE